jgi:AAA15 family ATPase/GTPase
MIQSLEVKNYRNLKHLQIQKLGQVNLIVGKNNTGKTSVLEAVSIYLSDGSWEWILQLLIDRDEFGRNVDNSITENAETVANLFYDREISYSLENQIKLNNVEQGNVVSLAFVKYREIIEELDVSSFRKKIILDESSENQDFIIGLQVVDTKGKSNIIGMDRRLYRLILRQLGLYQNIQYIRTSNIIREQNGDLWDNITLTEKEIFVIDALRIIETDIERVSFINTKSSSKTRKAVAKIKGKDKIIPISSMGDGINRILTIILAMVNCENGYLLIDEFENGLHHSVQSKLWEVIFYLSQKLNIQVFVTTHSSDSVRSFAQTLKDKNLSEDFGCLVRLENHEGNIIAREYDYDVLQSATEYNIETR